MNLYKTIIGYGLLLTFLPAALAWCEAGVSPQFSTWYCSLVHGFRQFGDTCVLTIITQNTTWPGRYPDLKPYFVTSTDIIVYDTDCEKLEVVKHIQTGQSLLGASQLPTKIAVFVPWNEDRVHWVLYGIGDYAGRVKIENNDWENNASYYERLSLGPSAQDEDPGKGTLFEVIEVQFNC